jgi:peptide/nickel transport system substrate-binding protein
MQSMDVVDSRTLKITLKSKNAVFPQNLTLIPFIASPKAIQEKGTSLTADPTNAGAGPFMMKSWVRNGQMVVVRNANYWNAPRPYLDQVIFQPILDEQQRINTFMSGQANMVFTGDAGSANTLTKSGAVGHPAALNGATNLYFNLRKPPFNDIRVRQAVAMGIDRADFAKVVGAGLIDPIHSIFRPDSPFYDPNILQIAYDPLKAQQLFDAAAQDSGGPITFTIATFTASNYIAAAEYMQAVLNKFKNVKVTIDPASSPVQQTRVISGDYTVAAFGNPFDDPEPGWTSLYTCSASPSFTGWCDQGFDALVADQRVTLDPSQRVKDIKDAQKIFYQAVPSLYYTRSSTYLFTPPSVQDFAWANDGLPLLNQFWIKS